ncbi:hypothetical protein GGE65_006331 [Skermanella aerolata]|uniref:hypothetical protein n=1 Tax=Skermanella aerolata TaxID=393310 RepID=UPI003D1C563B
MMARATSIDLTGSAASRIFSSTRRVNSPLRKPSFERLSLTAAGHPVALGFQMSERLQGLGKRRDLAAQAGHSILCDRQIGGQSPALLQ